MKTTLFLFALISTINISAQAAKEYAVQTWASVSSTPKNITIHWLSLSNTTNYTIYRKLKNENTWGAALATLPNTETTYEDTSVIVGTSYEYKIHKTGTINAFGYINSGIEVPAIHQKGGLLLLVDSTFKNSLETELELLEKDLSSDGWRVIRKNVDRNATAIQIKQIVTTTYSQHLGEIEAIYCFGHVPVPYSGNYAPDGHSSNHTGAWPADGFYGDIDGAWTDNSVNNTTASQTRNHNTIGDGKFDQTYFPSDLEMQVGRVDFANMPAFSQTEEELLRNYLNKSHAYKTGETKVIMKAIIDDNFGGFAGEAFSASAWKGISPILHPDSILEGDYRTSLDSASFVWSYGCGGGSYTSCNGIGNTNDLAGDSLQGIFSAFFGSYFGDWDSQNNLLRATLAQGTNLTNCWSGRPHWNFQHMGLGENIGYTTKLSMNNSGLYFTPLNFMEKIVMMGALGDPSLRMHILKPASNLTATYANSNTELTWTASTEPNSSYFLYRATDKNGPFVLLNPIAVSTTNYTDECIPFSNNYYYMVRTTKLEEVPSGSYHNLSLGVKTNIQIDVPQTEAIFTFSIVSNTVSLTNTSTNADTWLWNFGDGNTSTDFEPIHNFASVGNYTIALKASNSCSFEDLTYTSIEILTTKISSFYPNNKNKFYQYFDNIYFSENFKNQKISIINLNGQEVFLKENFSGENLDISILNVGIYFLKIDGSVFKFVKD